MKINFLHKGIMLALGALISWSPAQGQSWNPAQAPQLLPPIQTVRYDQAERPIVTNSIAASYAAEETGMSDAGSGTCNSSNSCNNCNSCNSCDSCNNCCTSCCDDLCCQATDCCGCPLPVALMDCRLVNFYAFSGIESWRGISDGAGPNNNGFVNGVNAAAPIPLLGDRGWAWQLGGTFGFYDLSGRDGIAHNSATQQQQYVTTGFFRRQNEWSRWSFGIVYDFSFNRNYGTAVVNPTLGQWRFQTAYATSAWNEFGVWGAASQLREAKLDAQGTADVFRSVTQINFFWHHKYQNLADSWFYIGVPETRKLVGTGEPRGALILGTNWIVPLSDRWAAYANGVYMAPNHSANALTSHADTWAVGIGLSWYPQGNARSSTVAGRAFMPYMPVANNGNFLVDTNNSTH